MSIYDNSRPIEYEKDPLRKSESFLHERAWEHVNEVIKNGILKYLQIV